MKRLIRKGKVKEVYDIGDDLLKFFFTDNISVFDKVISNDIPRKGESLCKTSTYWFKRTESELQINTHFIKREDDEHMIVKKVDVILDYEKIGPDTSNFLIPLEFISRYYVAGSLLDRINRGDVDYRKLGFTEKPVYGQKLPEPFFEMTTKLEAFDRPLTREEAKNISSLSEDELKKIEEAVMNIDIMMEKTVEKNGLLHVDGKKEFAMDENRELMLVDTFGTADEDRFWEIKDYKNGQFVEKSKEFVRKYYRDIGYHQELMDARDKGEDEPPIPPLPEDMVNKTSELYVSLMKRLTDGAYG
ncbi:MAG: phosphoribosylaminoimidazolesuccinocarboxamide synthase [Thermoplasmata archaeon]